MLRIYILILAGVLVINCAGKKKVGVSSSENYQTTYVMNDSLPVTAKDTLPLIVEFYSIGEGIKQAPKLNMDNFIKQYEKSLNKSISYQVIRWGREGEFDACFRLANLTESQQKNFVSELKKIFDEKSLVHILENQTCMHIR